jgi:hypothetical protein
MFRGMKWEIVSIAKRKDLEGDGHILLEAVQYQYRVGGLKWNHIQDCQKHCHADAKLSVGWYLKFCGGTGESINTSDQKIEAAGSSETGSAQQHTGEPSAPYLRGGGGRF